jgi:hypothetical protein
MFRAHVLVSVMLAGLFTMAACRREPQGIDALLGERARRPAPSSGGACLFDLSEFKAETVFRVLGYLDEYLGRHIMEDGDRVEGFYCNEREKVAGFRQLLQRLAAEQGLDLAVREETTQECLVSFHSRAIADRVNSCYRYQLSPESAAQGPDGTYRRIGNGSLLLALFMRPGGGPASDVIDRRRALPYLAGAWARHGRGDDFLFANSRDKANLIAQLLTMIGCRDVRLESNFGFIPQTNILRFTPTGEVAHWLGKRL